MLNWLIAVSIFVVLLKLYTRISAGVCRCKRDMTNKTVLITGANRGIGKETARELARRNARVILACRDLKSGVLTAKEITESTGNRNIVVKKLDLSSLSSVRHFCADIMSTESCLHVLINNAAGSSDTGFAKTEDGLELQFATNHFGPFLLTNLLLPLMKKSAPSRIIVVSSITHIMASLDLNNLNGELKKRHQFLVYCNTKLANILFIRELSRRLMGTGVTVNALHPGGVKTSIARNLSWRWWFSVIPLFYPFLKDSVSGAQTSIHLAVSEKVENVTGKYFADCKESWSSPLSQDQQLAKKLWSISEKTTGLISDETLN